MLKVNIIFTTVLLLMVALDKAYSCVFPNSELYKCTSEERYRSKLNLMNKLKYEDPKLYKQCLDNLKYTAGPFNISDVKTTVNYSGANYWNYDYNGRDWPKLYPECGGKMQSPINIVPKKSIFGKVEPLEFTNYTSIHPNINIINNGYTVDVSGPWGLTGDAQPNMRGGPLTGTYKLNGVHWHWGPNNHVGAEHSIKNQKKLPLELHFVHYNEKYSNVTEALNSKDREAIAVVAMTFHINKMSCEKSIKDTMVETLQSAFEGNLIYPAIFPLNIVKHPSPYYSYLGSLTTPPCNEVVKFIVYERSLPISAASMEFFRSIKVNGEIIEKNYRVEQPINDRKINYHCSH